MALPADAVPVGALPPDAKPVGGADEMTAASARTAAQGMDPAQRAAVVRAIRSPSPGALDNAALGAFSTKAQDAFDQQQEARALEYAAANANVPAVQLAKARQLWIAKPQYDLDYIVKNLPKIEQEVKAENIPWDRVAEQHPVLAKYLKDPSTVAQTLQDSASLTGLARWTGGNVEVLDENGKIDQHLSPAPWMLAAKDAIVNNTRAMFAKFGYSVFNADSQITESLRKVGVPDALLNTREDLADTKARWMEASRRYEAAGTAAKDYRGFFDQDAAGWGAMLGRAAEWGTEVLAKNADFLIGSALAKKTIGLSAFFTGYAATDVFPKAMEGTDNPFKAAALTALTAPVLGKVMEWSPAGTAVGARADSIIRNGVAKAAADALASRSWPSLARSIVLKGGWDALSGQLALGVQGATNAAVEQLALAWGGKEVDDHAVQKALYQGVTNLDGIPLSLFGTAHTLVSDIGRMHRASEMATRIENMHAAYTATEPADPKLREQQVRETAGQPGHDAIFYLPLARFQEEVAKGGNKLDPREVAKEIHGSYDAYDKAVQEGASHLPIPVEKMRTVFTSKVLGDLAVNEGVLDTDVMSRLQAAKVSEEFQNALKEGMKINPDAEDAKPEDKAVYAAVLAQAGDDPATAKEVFATIKGLQQRHPQFTAQQLFAATWGPGGLFGPKLDAANEAVPGMHKEAEAARNSIIDAVMKDSGLYNSREWMQSFKDDQKKLDLVAQEKEAQTEARARIETAIKDGVRRQIANERDTMEKKARVEIQKDAGQRVRHFFTDNELWGAEKADPAVVRLTNPETGEPFRLLRSEVRALGFDPDQMPKGTMTDKPALSMDVDMAANNFGYSGSAVTGTAARLMLANLRDSMPEGAWHKAWADVQLRNLHTSTLLDNPRELMASIMDSVHNEKVVPMMLSRLRALAGQLDPVRKVRSAMTADAWEGFANRIINDKTLRDLKPENFARAAKAASERALEALEKGNHGKAFDATEAALLNHYLYRAAREMEGSMGAMFSKISEHAGSKALRATIGKADPVYRQLYDAITGSLGFGATGQVNPDIDQVGAFLSKAKENGQEQNLANDQDGGWDSQLVRGVLSGEKAWRDLTPSEAKQVFTALKNIEHVAKLQREEMRALRNADRDSLLNSSLRFMSGIRPGKEGPILPGEDIVQSKGEERSKLSDRWIIAQMWHDAYNETPRLILKYMGPEVKEKIDGGFLDSKMMEHSLLQNLYEPWKETQKIWENDPEFHEPLPGLAEALRLQDANGHPLNGDLPKKYLVQLVKWMGSVSGRKKALDAFGVSASEVFKLAGAYLKPHELEAINAEHEFFDTHLLPRKAEAWERRKGLPFETVKPLSYSIDFGHGDVRSYRGGYYPIHWDGRPGLRQPRVISMDKQSGGDTPAVSDGSFKERTKFVGIPDLDWNNVPAHLLADVHNLAFGDFVQEANRVLLDPRMEAAVVRYLGPEYGTWAENWLERVAHESAGSVSGHLANLGDAARLSRSAFITGAIGLNLPIFSAHMVHPLAVAVMRDGLGGLVNAGSSMLRVMESAATNLATGTNPLHEEIMSKSKYLPLYLSDLKENMGRWFKGTYDATTDSWMGSWDRAQDKAQMVGFWHLRVMTELVSQMIWDAKYRREMSQHGDEGKSIDAADEQVRASMPNYNVMEVPSILAEKKGVAISSLLVFHTFWAKYREMFNEGKHDMSGMPFREAMAGEGSKAGAAWSTAKFAGRAAAMLTFGVTMGELLKGQGKRDDEDWASWFMLREAVSPFKMFPYASDLFEHGLTDVMAGKVPKRDVGLSNPFFAPIVRGINAVQHDMDPKRPNDEKVAEAAMAALMLAGFPAVAPVRAARYGYRVATGDETPRGPFDAASGAIFNQKYGRLSRYNEATPLTIMQDVAKEGSK